MILPREIKNKQHKIIKNDDNFIIPPPIHKGLVLSGGGAKGIAYGGMIRAMQETGKLSEITHVSGASAGAMTASFIALGINHQEIEKLLLGINTKNLLDNSGVRFRARGKRFINVLDVIYLYQLKNRISQSEPKTFQEKAIILILLKKISSYEEAMKKHDITINSIDDIISLANSKQKLEALGSALAPFDITDSKRKSSEESKRINFLDLKRLQSCLPENKKFLIKDLSVVTTNITKKRLETFNSDNSGKESIAQTVQQSGAHPLLFASSKNIEGDNISDGGILDNMPNQALEDLGLKSHEILCVSLEEKKTYNESIQDAQQAAPLQQENTSRNRTMNAMSTKVLGGAFPLSRIEVKNRKKIFYQLDNLLFLNAGEITTTKLSATAQQKENAINNAYQNTKDLFSSQTKTFDTFAMALLYLGKDELNKLILEKDQTHDFLQCSVHIKEIFLIQEQIGKELLDDNAFGVVDYLEQIEAILKLPALKLDVDQCQKALSLCIKQINFFSEGRLETHLAQLETKSKNTSKNQTTSRASKLLSLLKRSIEWMFSIKKAAAVKKDQTVTDGLSKVGIFSAEDNTSLESEPPTDKSTISLPKNKGS